MTILYRDSKEIDKEELEHLFLSVEWSSGRYPNELQRALRNYGAVFTAWDGNHLVGLVGAIDDKVMTAYVHYLLVDPRYQGQGIGAHMLDLLKQYYAHYLRIVLIAYPNAIPFYERHGFKGNRAELAMAFTEMDD